MALAIDGSTPTVVLQSVNTTTTVTTASFTPPAGALLLILWQGNTGSGINPGTPTVTDNLGTHLTYTLTDWQSHANAPAVSGQSACWWAVVGTSAAMTVTVTTGTASGNCQAVLQVVVITGQHATPIGAHGKSGSASAVAIAQTYTAQATGGWGFIGVCDWAALGAESAGTGCTVISSGSIAGQISYGDLRRTTADDSNGASNTLNVVLLGTSTDLTWVYVEVVPAASAAGTLPTGPALGQASARRIAGQSYITQSAPQLLPPGPVPPGINAVAGLNRPSAGSAVVITPRTEPYLNPPGSPQPPTTPAVLPRTGSALIIAPRADTTAPDVPPVPIVDVSRAAAPAATGSVVLTTPRAPDNPPTPVVAVSRAVQLGQAAGTVTTTRPTTDPAALDIPPAPIVITSRSITPTPDAGTAALMHSTADPAAITDFPPSPIIDMSRPNLGPPIAGSATTTRPTSDPTAPPPGPAPLALVARTTTGPTAAPTAVIGHTTADPTPDARPPMVITTIGMPAETLGWAILTRPATDPAQPARTLVYIASPTPTWTRIGSSAVGVPRNDFSAPPIIPIIIGLDGAATAGTVEGAGLGSTVDSGAQSTTLDGAGTQPAAVASATTSTGSVS